ncbi:MAG: ABC transporter transmembrane domain-containing protein, partial [Candidatus Kapabacteria bacterium]|nr:ABC transporter transmembrane domain-containing protein [Candidatus Kapabacteria bacterium]
LFHSAAPIIKIGRQRPLTPEDAPPLPPELNPRNASQRYATLDAGRFWPFFLGAFFATGAPARRILGLTVVKLVVGIGTPLILHRLLTLLPMIKGATSLPVGALLVAVALGTVGMIGALIQQHWYFNALQGFALIMNGLNERVVQHALRLRRSARAGMQTGDMVNHLSSDTDAIAESVFIIPEFTNILLQTSVVLAVLWYFLGVATLAAVVTLVLVSPLTVVVARRFRHLDHAIMELRDERVTLMSQILQGIRVVKFHAWENSVRNEISGVRSAEIHTKIKTVHSDAVGTVIFISTTTLVAFVGFGAYVLGGGTLTAPLVFACLALFAMLEEPFGMISHLLANLQHARVAAGRLHAYFSAAVRREDLRPLSEPLESIGLACSNLVMQYPDGESPALKNLSLHVPAGTSLAIIGSVGAGKSTLLRTLVGLHVTSSGYVSYPGLSNEVRPRSGYVPQEAFIVNATLRENIVFGDDEGAERLANVIRACALEQDISHMSGGLATEIGERGVNLSGGQKQRVSLARAAYHRPGIVFLDDPLSAVDYETESILVDRLLFSEWKSITRIVVTHRLAHLHAFDQIVVMENGEIVMAGSYDEIMSNSAVRNLVESAVSSSTHEENHTGHASAVTPIAAPHVIHVEVQHESSRQTEDEDRATGAVRSGVYVDYVRAMIGHRKFMSPLILMALIGTAIGITILPILQTSWLGYWTDTFGIAGRNTGHGLWNTTVRFLNIDVTAATTAIIAYGILGVVVLTGWYGERLLWLYRAAAAGRVIHDQALVGVLAAPLRFFDSTPMGRILNRFARDVESVDDRLSWNFEQSFKSLAQTIGALVLILTVMPIIIVVIVPVLFLYYRLQRDYRRSAREAKRLESIARSPRYAHFKELVTGLDVIHGFGRESHFIETFHDILLKYQQAFWCSIMLNRWFSSRVPLVSGLVGLATSMMIVVLAWQGSISSGVAGLVLTYALSFWMSLNWAVRSFSEVESQMTSVERLRHYASLEPEPSTTSADALSDNVLWPTEGALEVRNLCVRYAAHLPRVLHDVSFTITPRMKVGIIGRTGSGKSTLFQTIFRFIEPESGQILIDGVDITCVPLQRLRRNVAIIPQDPTLFIGSIRSNLDRFSECSDTDVWDALRRVQLLDHVRSLPDGLQSSVLEGGVNFSQGQRQLLCLARAILTRARIIVLDEATASVDLATDAVIQRTIREEFVNVTVLVIAHRLDTVADADMRVELAQGRVVSITKR